jgi:hypothetical protein
MTVIRRHNELYGQLCCIWVLFRYLSSEPERTTRNLSNDIRSPNTDSKFELPEQAAEALITMTLVKISSSSSSSSSRTEIHVRNGPTQTTKN